MNVPSNPGPRLASVIVPCFNRLESTRECVASLFRHTRSPWELIAVDNGSRDGTAEYLRGVRDASPHRVEVITNPESRGSSTACNQGLALARGDYLILLANDAVVTDAWLDQLIGLAESGPRIGMTGPMSNDAPPPQLVEGVSYDSMEAMHTFALRWRDEHRGHWLTTGKLAGFCVLIKRRVFEEVGGPDERPGPGPFEEDLSMRVRRAGYELAVARDLFVHHLDGRTLSDASPSRTVASTPGKGGPGRRRRVSLSMIVRDEEHNLPACLASAKGLFDEIVVADTGSADRTKEIARSFGARVLEFPWIDDFAAARNASLAGASGNYVFWLDADDRVEPLDRVKLRALFDGLGPGDDAAYVVRCACDPDVEGLGGAVVDHIRLFPRRENVRWTYRVHEQILPSLRRAGIPVRWSDATIRHVGYNDPAVRRRKLERDVRLLEASLLDRPGDPFVLFNLGWIAVERKDPAAALGHLRESLSRSGPTDSITRKLYALIAQAHQMLGEHSEARAVCASGLAVAPGDSELLFREGIVRRLQGDREGAESCWRQILENPSRPEHFASVATGLEGHLVRRNLAVLAEERGDRPGAARLWREVQAECPGDRDADVALARLDGRGLAGA